MQRRVESAKGGLKRHGFSKRFQEIEAMAEKKKARPSSALAGLFEFQK
jgi:hypothetical protein